MVAGFRFNNLAILSIFMPLRVNSSYRFWFLIIFEFFASAPLGRPSFRPVALIRARLSRTRSCNNFFDNSADSPNANAKTLD